jgi:tetratricopeptide (TPR) repeat protein
MARWMFAFVLMLGLFSLALAQQDSRPDQSSGKGQSAPTAARDREAGESSSKSTRIDLSPPKDDAKAHPRSGEAVTDADEDAEPGDVQEMHAWDPHRASKNVEVGDYYFRRKNYRAALDRYSEALQWKPDDAVANFRMGECLEKMHQPDQARVHYEAYLKILPHGPLSEDAQKALSRLKGGETAEQKPRNVSQ